MNVIMERYPYRYVEVGTLENGKPDFRIQKEDRYTKRYKDMLRMRQKLLTPMKGVDTNYE